MSAGSNLPADPAGSDLPRQVRHHRTCPTRGHLMTAPTPRPATTAEDAPADRARSPWPALWALVLGFFMILVDSTIVSVATPAIMTGLQADINEVVWVT